MILCLLSDPDLKLTFSVLPINSLNLSVVICVSQSFISCVVGSVDVLLIFCNCNNVFVNCKHMIVTGYVLLEEKSM